MSEAGLLRLGQGCMGIERRRGLERERESGRARGGRLTHIRKCERSPVILEMSRSPRTNPCWRLKGSVPDDVWGVGEKGDRGTLVSSTVRPSFSEVLINVMLPNVIPEG